MKKLYILFLLSLPVALIAQTVTVSEDLSIRNDKFYTLVGKMKNRVLVFRDKSTEFEVQAYDERLRLSWSKQIELDKKRPEIMEVIPGNDFFSIIYRFKHKGHLYAKIHRYDPAANLIDSMTIYDYGQRFSTPEPQIIYSEDKSKFVVYHNERLTEIEAFAYDIDKQTVLWESKFTLPEILFSRNYQTAVVDNLGNLYYVQERENKKSNKEEHEFVIYTCGVHAESVNQITIPVPEFLTYDVHFTYDNLHSKLVAAGLYSDKNKGRSNGFYYMKIDLTQPDNFLLQSESFEDDFASSLMGKNADGEKGVTDIDIQEIVLRRDGGMLIIAERNREYERRMSSVGRGYIGRDGSRYIVDYYYEDICLISVHPDGETHWKTILHKKQYSQDDEAVFSSFFLAKTPTSLRFLFNDEIKDENTVSEYVVNAAGKFDRNSVMSTDDQKIRLRFRDAMQTGANELIVPSERRNKLRLVRVQY